MSTILACIQEACKRTGLPSPSVAVTSTDENVISMLRFMEQAGKELVHSTEWPELTKEFTFSLVDGQEAYPMPPDLNSQIADSHWDRDNHWPLIGPITPQEWQYRKSGISTLSPRVRYRIKGWSSNTFYVLPTPTATDAGHTMVFEYSSENWLRPATVWSAGLSVSGTDYVYYGDNIYSKVSGTTTGATAPTHSIGSVSDGGVTWAFASYEGILADTDVPLLRDELLIEGARWRFKREKGLDYQEIKQTWEEHIRIHCADSRGSSIVGFAKRIRGTPLISPWSIRDGNYGQ